MLCFGLVSSLIVISNHLSHLLENCCSRFPASQPSQKWRTMGKALKQPWQKLLGKPSQRSLVPTVEIGYYQPFIWPVRMPSTLSGTPLSRSGRPWCITHQRPVRDSFRPVKCLTFVNDSYSQGNFARTRDPTHVAPICGGSRTARGSVVHLFLVVLTNNTFRPVSAPRVSCAGSLGNVFWAR